MPDLVAIDLPGGLSFVDALRSAWAAGDAVAPLDQRLAPPARQRLLDMLRPSRVITPGGIERHHGAVPVDEGDALVVVTSASTGASKGVVLTHTAVAASARATSARLGVVADRHSWLACLPLSHVGGLSVVTRSLLTGTPLKVLDGFDAAQVAASAADNVFVALVPTALGRVNPGAFHTVLLGGSAPPAALPPNVVTTYGMTETGSGVVYDGLPLDGVEIALSAEGEVRLRGPMLLRAYRDGTVPLDENGWFATGDVGALDGTGRLQVKGRLSDLIITGGENVWPAAVEQILRQHPGVAEVAVSSRPDPEWGERLVACVVPARPPGPPGLAELRALVADQLASFAAPKELVILEALPKTSIGKLKRQALRERLLSEPSRR
jgi:O-succinylbenzoic acid--CoA ligase